ncbi:hypothetical protein FQN57_000624 [Myotisia sp. PD_48]|nr:hypothetical protein FQN57_000624 [Myotisia sp. PD_48]
MPEDMINFNLVAYPAAQLASRIGRLCRTGRKPIQTPHYVPITSRGIVPHITHDMMRDHLSLSSLYVGLEDFIERTSLKETPPIYNTPTSPSESALRNFLVHDDDTLLVLGPRRIPPVPAPAPNSSNSITVLTSVGYQQLVLENYIEAIQKLQPDIAIGMADVVLGREPGVKRRARMIDRTHAWTQGTFNALFGTEDKLKANSNISFFAPLLPLDLELQGVYLQELAEDMNNRLSGLALFDPKTVSIIPEPIQKLARLSLAEPQTPQKVLSEVALGIDLSAIPFITTASDAGMALDFVFPTPSSQPISSPLPLAIDVWSPVHDTDVSPLVPGCQCHTCQNFHRAYLRHVLNAKEMVAWTLLQIHNYHTVDNFFAAIRASIQSGTFEADVQTFTQTYEPEFPEQSGQGPRLRGYQFKTGAGEKVNPKAFGRLDEAVNLFTESQSSVVTPDAEAEELEERGFAEKTK